MSKGLQLDQGDRKNRRQSNIYLDNHIFYVLLNESSKRARAWDLSESEVGQSEKAGPPFDTVLDVAGIATNWSLILDVS